MQIEREDRKTDYTAVVFGMGYSTQRTFDQSFNNNNEEDSPHPKAPGSLSCKHLQGKDSDRSSVTMDTVNTRAHRDTAAH